MRERNRSVTSNQLNMRRLIHRKSCTNNQKKEEKKWFVRPTKTVGVARTESLGGEKKRARVFVVAAGLLILQIVLVFPSLSCLCATKPGIKVENPVNATVEERGERERERERERSTCELTRSIWCLMCDRFIHFDSLSLSPKLCFLSISNRPQVRLIEPTSE